MAEKQVSVRIKAEGGGQLKAEFQAIGNEAQKSFGQIGRGAKGGGQALQNAGYQVQDFAVQVASGTDASRALAQQLPQLLSGFGLIGVMFGTVAAVAIPLFAAFGMGKDKAKELAESVKELDAAMSALRSATSASSADPSSLFGDFGSSAGQAREVLEIQRQIAAARAQNSLAQASGAITSLFGNPDNLDLTLRKIAEVRAEIARAGSDPALRESFDFTQAYRQLEFYQEVLTSLYDNIGEKIGVDLAGAEAQVAEFANSLLALRNAEGPEATATALARARAALIDLAESGDGANEEVLQLLQSLTDAELAALGLSRVDMASSIGVAADEAARLAVNLQAAAQEQLRQMAIEFSPGGQAMLKYGSRAPGGSSDQQALEDRNKPKDVSRGRGGGGGGGARVSEAEREAARIYDQTRTAAEKYAIELEKLNDLHQAGKLDTETYTRAVEKLGKDLDKAGDLGKKAASAIRGAFDNLFDDPAAALKNLSKQLFQMALYAQLAKSMPNVFGSNGIIPLMNANGNVFAGGMVQAFAAGGIVSSATMFPMRGGVGVMGEAGPEAIMPLTRVGGKLGVASAGGGGVVVKNEVHNYSGASVSQERGRGPNGEVIVRTIVGKQLASGEHDASLRSRFGTKPNPVKR